MVYLGNQSVLNAAQTITLTGDVTIDRIFMEATGDRSYTITENSGGAPYTLTFDPGQANFIDRTVDATSDFAVAVPVITLRDSSPLSVVNASSTGRVTIGQGVQIDPPTMDGLMTFSSGGGGLVEVQGPVIFSSSLTGNSRWNVGAGNQILFNPPSTASLLNRPMVVTNSSEANAGTLSFARDTTFGNRLWILVSGANVGALNMRLFEAEDRDVVVTYNSIDGFSSNAVDAPNVINVLGPADGSTGTFTLAVLNDLTYAGAGRSVRINLAENTFFKLGRHMVVPNAEDIAGGVHGEGGLIKDGGNSFSDIFEQNSYTGGTYIHDGMLRLRTSTIPISRGSGTMVTFDGRIGPGMLYIASGGTFNLNGLNQIVSGLSELDTTTGQVLLNGGTLTIDSSVASEFASAAIDGAGGLVKSGSETFTLLGDYTNPAGRTLRVEQGILAVDGHLTIQDGVFELAGGIIDLETNNLFTVDQLWNVTLTQSTENLHLLNVANADITGAQLSLGLADGYDPAEGTAYTLLFASGTITGADATNMFGFSDGQLISIGTPSGGDPLWAIINWVEGSESIVLNVVPEPGTATLLFLAVITMLLARRRPRPAKA